MKPIELSWHSEEESRMLHGSFSESNNMSDPPSDRIRRLTSTTPDGKPYVRPAAVQAEIETLFDLPASAVLAKRRKLRKETLVFFTREFRHKDDYVSGELLERLQKRTADTIRGRVKHLRQVDQEDIVMQVDMEIIELILCEDAFPGERLSRGRLRTGRKAANEGCPGETHELCRRQHCRFRRPSRKQRLS